MKKGIFALVFLLLCVFSYQANAADYFACAAGEVHANNVWCTAEHANGSCSNDGTTEANTAAILIDGNSFYANGCAMTIESSVTVTKFSTAANGEVDGGTFSVATNATPITITAAIEAGASTAGLTVTGTAVGDPVTNSVLNIVAPTIAGGGGANCRGVSDGHTVGVVAVTSSSGVSSGSNGTADGYYWSGGTPTANPGVIITGNCKGTTARGFNMTGAGNAKVIGSCIGSDTAVAGVGCNNGGLGGITITGNIIFGTKGSGAEGGITWEPAAASNYIQFKGGTDVYASQAPDKAKVLNDTSVVVSTTGAYETGTATTTGGGGAWAQ